MDAEMQELSSLIWELETSATPLRVASRASALRRRLEEGVRRLEDRRLTARFAALSAALNRALRKCGAQGLATKQDREQLLGENDGKETVASLARTRQLLAAGLEQINEAHAAVDADGVALRGVETYQKRIGDAMVTARRLIRKIQKREEREKLSMTLALVVYYLVVAFIVWRRLPLRTLLSLLVRALLFPFRRRDEEQEL